MSCCNTYNVFFWSIIHVTSPKLVTVMTGRCDHSRYMWICGWGQTICGKCFLRVFPLFPPFPPFPLFPPFLLAPNCTTLITTVDTSRLNHSCGHLITITAVVTSLQSQLWSPHYNHSCGHLITITAVVTSLQSQL